MHADYISLVLLKYKKGVQANQLSTHLSCPTPANLRDECATVCKYRFDKNDQRILRDFFGHYENQRSYIQAIEAFDIDKFRPLLNFISGRISKTSEKNIELLAWLLDVRPRPFQRGFDYESVDTSTDVIVEKNNVSITEDAKNLALNQFLATPMFVPALDKKQTLNKSPWFSKRRAIITGMLLLLISLVIAGLWWIGLHSGNCMYWNNDRYELVACDKKMQDVLLIAADNNRLKNFRKINREDTITAAAIGYVWYSKIDNKLEYFTADGYHPVKIQYHLKPLTLYIIEHHLAHHN